MSRQSSGRGTGGEASTTLRSSTLLPKLTHAAMRHRASGGMGETLDATGPSNLVLLSPMGGGMGATMPNLGAHALERESRRISRQLSSATPKKLKRLTESNQLSLVQDMLKQSKKDIDQLLIQNWLDNELDSELEGEGRGPGPLSFSAPGSGGEKIESGADKEKAKVKRLVYSQIDLVRAGLSHETAQRAQRALYVYAVGFCDVLKELTSHCQHRDSLVSNLWSAFIVIAEKMMQTHFHSEFLSSLKAQHKALAKCNSLKQHMQVLKTETGHREEEMSRFEADLQASEEHNKLLGGQVISLKKALETERDQTNNILRRYTREAERVQELQQIVYRLEKENRNLLNRERNIMRTARQSEYKYLEKEEQATNAYQKAERMQTENEGLYSEIASLKLLSESLEASNKELKDANVAQHLLFEEEAKARIKLQNDLVHYRDLYSNEEAKNVSLSNELDQVTMLNHQSTCALQDLEQAKGRLEERMKNTSDSLSQATIETEQLTQELKNSREKTAILEVELGEATTKLTRVTTNSKLKDESILKLETEHAHTLQELDKAKSQVVEDQTLINSSGVAMAVFFKHVSNQRTISHSLYESKKSLEKQYFSLNRDDERKSRKLMQLNHELLHKNSELDDLQKQRVELTSKVDDLCKKEEEIVLATTKLSNELTERNSELQRVTQELNEQLTKTNNLEKKATVLQSSNREMNEELSSVKKHVQTLSSDLGKAEASRSQLQNNLSKTQHKLVTAETQLESDEQELSKMTETCKELEEKMAELTDKHLTLEQERDNLNQSGLEYSSKLAELEKKSSQIQRALDESEAGRRKAEESTENLKKGAEELQGELESARSDHSKVVEESQENCLELENKLGALSKKYEEMTSERDGLNENLTREVEANAKLVDDKETAEKMLRQAQAVRTFLQDEITALKNKTADLKKQVISESERARHYQQLIKKLQNGETLDGEEASLVTQLEELKKQLAAKDDEFIKESRLYEEKLKYERGKIKELKIEVDSAQGMVRILEQQIEELTSSDKEGSPKKDDPLSPKMNPDNFVPSYQAPGQEIGNLYNLLLSPEPMSWTSISQLLLKTRGKNHAVSWLSQKEAVTFNKDMVRRLILHLYVSWTTTAGRAWVDQNRANKEASQWLDYQYLPNITSHTYDYMLSRFGIIALAESCLRAMSSSVVKQAAKGDKRCYVFARMCCLEPSAFTEKDEDKKICMDAVVEGNRAQSSLCKWLAIIMCQLWWNADSITVEEESGKILVPYARAKSIVSEQIKSCEEGIQETTMESFGADVEVIKLPDVEEEFANIDDVLYCAVMAWDEQVQFQAQKVIDLYISRGLTQHLLSQNEFLVILKHSFRALFDQPMGKLSLPADVSISQLYRDSIKASKFSDHVTAEAFASLLCQFGWIRVNIPEEVKEKVCNISIENTKATYTFEELKLLQDVWETIQTPLSDASKMGYITPEEVESFARLLLQKATSSPIWQLFRRIINKWWISSLKDH
ncbi:hypothetical protein HOP50_03g24160 [Chloropicon primus]|uniref:Uncharacterized protein n=2 Tax=Chloropicon primus TaxID=1764295 RepID=A0A5B8MHH7_9CHLO|nr:hypothetical protein A3770_03p24170 [Chloropicon primus]UPQ99110.1 hypothetical protein HOP50_03g24160 [Chloropicon primus]|eukprot:QDZ19899.1 hypothetical protein A3770_03p24170 [Chloropicon primus]